MATQIDDLELIGPYESLSGVWLMILQHGADWKIINEQEADAYMMKHLGVDLSEAEHVRASIDLIADAGSAIREVQRNGLYVHRHPFNPGEAYLRLYGVLNAAYMIVGAIRQMANSFMSHRQGALLKELRREPFYELRNRLGAHPLDFGGARRTHNRIAQVDMYNLNGKRSYVSSDRGYKEVDIMEALTSFERACLSALLELTEYKAAKVIKRKSEHRAWVDERIEYVRGKLSQQSHRAQALP